MKTQYVLVTAANPVHFITQVNDFLEEGWTLYGSPFSDSSENTTRLCQAMVQHTEVLSNTIHTDPATGKNSLM